MSTHASVARARRRGGAPGGCLSASCRGEFHGPGGFGQWAGELECAFLVLCPRVGLPDVYSGLVGVGAWQE
eukprot:5196560-Lingulodinium_polyedra.AAC.1